MEARLNSWINDMVPIFRDLRTIHKSFVEGALSGQDCRNRAAEMKIGERLEKNAQQGDAVHILSEIELRQGLPDAAVGALKKTFGLKPEEVEPRATTRFWEDMKAWPSPQSNNRSSSTDSRRPQLRRFAFLGLTVMTLPYCLVLS